MAKDIIRGKDLLSLGYPPTPVVSLAMGIVDRQYKYLSKTAKLGMLTAVLEHPRCYLEDEALGKIARALLPEEEPAEPPSTLNEAPIEFFAFGRGQIEQSAIAQMELACRLPVSRAGALMPDAHAGYGLPIGGVLATEQAVIPYAVGVDIGCSMHLSLFDIPEADFQRKASLFARILESNTLFGSGAAFSEPADHEVMYRSEFKELSLLAQMRARAWKQLGSSGSGNHFVEFGLVDLEGQRFVGLLSHSGSRGLGAQVANHYTKIAREKRRLPREANHMAWLRLDEAEGLEYWMAMNLAGEYARACHEVIHQKIAASLGRAPIRHIANHHNLAYREVHQGQEWIVHRKGATPAHKDIWGIIPGSMTVPGYIVKGKGNPESFCSAAHGAGRRMSRAQAAASITHHALREELERHGVRLLGGGLDEAPHAYKDIKEVMKAQESLVEVVGTFTPKIVRMDE